LWLEKIKVQEEARRTVSFVRLGGDTIYYLQDTMIEEVFVSDQEN